MQKIDDLKRYNVLDAGEVTDDIETVEEDDDTLAQQKGTDTIFENGPTYDQLADWKARHNNEIYMSDFGDTIFLWRPLRRKEFKTISKRDGAENNQFYVDEEICRLCVLWPLDFAQHSMAFGKAGIPTTLSALITENSGFNRPVTYKV